MPKYDFNNASEKPFRLCPFSILDKKRIQFSSINLFSPSLLSINGMYFPSFDAKLFLIAQTAHDGITLRTPFPELL